MYFLSYVSYHNTIFANGGDPILEKAAIDLFKNFPPMYPAKNIKGEAVDCYYKYPINFRLKD